jgi:hypothetical protein
VAIATPTRPTAGNGASLSSITTGSVTATTGGVMFLFTACGGTTERTITAVSGLGGTWSFVAADAYSDGIRWRVECWVGVGCTGTGTISVTFSGTWSSGRGWMVIEYASGVDTTTPVVQSNTATVAPGASQVDVTLSAFADSTNNAAGGFASHRVVENLVPDTTSGWTEIAQWQAGTPANTFAFQNHPGEDTTVSYSWADTTHGGLGIALEIAATSSGVTGTAAWSEGADTCAGAGTTTVTGTASWTEGADTVAASGWILVTGTAAWTEGADTVAASGTSAQFIGAGAWTEGADTVAASGTFTTTGTAAWTEGADTAAGTGTVITPTTGTAAWTEGADTAAGSGTFTTTGTSAWTEGADTCAASGTSTPPPVTGTAAWTEAADTCTASGNYGPGTIHLIGTGYSLGASTGKRGSTAVLTGTRISVAHHSGRRDSRATTTGTRR